MNLRSFAALLGAALLSACGPEGVQEIVSTPPGASVKFFNFGVNAPGVNYYANDIKLTAISSTSGAESTSGTTYGAAGNAGLYSGVAPGAYTFTGRIAAATDKDVAITSVASTLADGKYYSMYTSGFYNSATKQVESFLVADDFPATIDYTVAYVRFVNAISNSSPMTLYAKNTATGVEVAIGAAVAYKQAGAFVAIPIGPYDLSTRVSGSSANAIVRTAVGFSPGRTYTIASRGDMTVTSTTATNRPQLDNTVNR
jgi:hypothetical protein